MYCIGPTWLKGGGILMKKVLIWVLVFLAGSVLLRKNKVTGKRGAR